MDKNPIRELSRNCKEFKEMSLREEINLNIPFRNMDIEKGIQVTINLLKRRVDEMIKANKKYIEEWKPIGIDLEIALREIDVLKKVKELLK